VANSLACIQNYQENILNQKHSFILKNKTHIKNGGSDTNLQGVNKVIIDPAMRLRMIAITAYFRAEKRGFSARNDTEDWLVSEKEVDRHLSSFSS
jgi:hypothetical protein